MLPHSLHKGLISVCLLALLGLGVSTTQTSRAAALAPVPTPNAPNIDLPLPNLIVTTTAIADDPSDGQCDLWEALQAVFQANNGLPPTYHECTAKVSGQNIIGFSVVGGTITVPAVGPRTDLPFVHGDTVIVGPITIAGSGSSADTHLLHTAPGATLTVIAVVLKNGHTSGAGPAIYSDNGATVNVIGSFLINNTADNDGGAIYSNGDLNLMGTSFVNNQAKGLTSSGVGGAVYVTGYGSFKSEASTFTANQATSGGAIYLGKSGGESSISDSIFTGNNVSADANGLGGGAVYNASSGGTLTIERTAFNGNFTTQGAGGAIVNGISATTLVTNTLFDANIAGDPAHARNAGAIYNQGPLAIAKTTFVANVAQGGSGGAIENDSAGQVTIGNATFNGNVVDAQGGAIYETASSTMAIRNSTFASNNASGQGGILYLGGTAQLQIGNTILDGSTTLAANCAGNALTSLGHNIDTGTSCGLNASGDMASTNPLLGPLGFHGGGLPVLTTQLPDYTSLAVDHGDNVICADPSVNNEDETGSKRPKDANNTGSQACDIGAIELDARKPAFDAAPMPPGPINFGSVQVNHTVTATFDVHDSGNYLLTLSNRSVVDNAHFGVVTTFPVAVDVNVTKTIVLSCTPTNNGPLATTLSFNTTDSDHPTASYSLLCNGVPNPAPAFVSFPVAPGPIEFGEVTIGTVATQTITIKNGGTADLHVNRTAFNNGGGNFGNPGTWPLTFAPGASGQVVLTCQPNKVGVLAGQLQISTDDASQASQSYNLNCSGVPPQSAYLIDSQDLRYPWLPSDFTGLFGVATSPDGLDTYVTGGSSLGGQVVTLKKLSGIYLSDGTGGDSRSLLSNPHGIAVSPNGNCVLAVGSSNSNLVEYQRDSGSGNLTYAGYAHDGLYGVTMNYPWDVAISPDSRHAYITSYGSNGVAIFGADCNSFGGFGFLGMINSTTMTTHTLNSPTGIAVSPDGRNVYVAAYTGSPTTQGTLAVYSRNASTGALTPIQTRYQGDLQDEPGCFLICFPLNGLKGPVEVAISPDGLNVYVTGKYSNAVVNFQRDQVTGLLRWIGTYTNGSGGVTSLNTPWGVAVSPDSKHVYVTSNGNSALVVFDRETSNGYLTFHEAHVRGDSGAGSPALAGVYQTAVSSDGQYIFAAAATDNAVAVFRVANPQPALFSLLPASAAAGGSGFTLVVKGSGYVDGAYVSWDSFHPTSTFINSSEVHATIPAAYIAGSGNHTIKVTNPTPGGGDSYNTLTFQVLSPAAPPVPSIDHIVPAGVVAGASGVQVDIYGSNFKTPGFTVTANGAGAVYNYIDSTHVRITAFNANTFAQPGTVNIQVSNSGVQSNIVGLNVAAPGENPVPSITALSPAWVWSLGAGSPEAIVTITGNNFVDGAVVQWNGDDRPTQFINSTKLQATIYGTDQLSPAYNSILVKNPTPGGGESNVLTFIVRPLHKLFIPLLLK